MKYLIASDIHGNVEAFEKVFNFFLTEDLDELILLGDIFTTFNYENSSSLDISKMLWKIPSKLHCILGNCDNPNAEQIMPVGFVNYYEYVIGTKRFLCFHGNRTFYTGSKIDIYISGHTHCYYLSKEDGIIRLNPGSVGRPRDYTNGSFAVMSEKTITIFDLDYNVISELNI